MNLPKTLFDPKLITRKILHVLYLKNNDGQIVKSFKKCIFNIKVFYIMDNVTDQSDLRRILNLYNSMNQSLRLRLKLRLDHCSLKLETETDMY